MPSREKLFEFVEWSRKHVTGDEKGQAQVFLDRLFQAFGQAGSLDLGGHPEFRIRKADEDGGGTAFADYVSKAVNPGAPSSVPSNRIGSVGTLLLAATCSLMMASGARAQSHTIIKSFGVAANVMGFNPRSELVQGADGNLYGTTSSGDGNGTVFKVSPNGAGYTVLKWFSNPAEGANP